MSETSHTTDAKKKTPLEDLLRPLSEKPSPEHQGLLTELHYDFSRDFSLASLVGAYFKLDTNPNEENGKGYFKVITSVKQLSKDVVEIRRKNIYRHT